jgi:hypothetical protein
MKSYEEWSKNRKQTLLLGSFRLIGPWGVNYLFCFDNNEPMKAIRTKKWHTTMEFMPYLEIE